MHHSTNLGCKGKENVHKQESKGNEKAKQHSLNHNERLSALQTPPSTLYRLLQGKQEVMEVTADSRSQPRVHTAGTPTFSRQATVSCPVEGAPPTLPTVDRNEGGLQPKSHGTEALNLPTSLE